MKKFYVMYEGLCVAIFRKMEDVAKFLETEQRNVYVETRYEESRRPVKPF